jgi:hypothetical protein
MARAQSVLRRDLLPVALAVALAWTLGMGAGSASAQTGPVYTATPPTYGALYRDGQTDKWLLGGTWL